MKNNYHLDELEAFLSDSADQHRMYPSDRVWRNIDKELHGQKKWPALTFGALLIGAIITAGLILIHPDKNLFDVNYQASVLPTTQPAKVDNKNPFASDGLVSPRISNSKIGKNKHISENGIPALGEYTFVGLSDETVSGASYQAPIEVENSVVAISVEKYNSNAGTTPIYHNDLTVSSEVFPHAGLAIIPNEWSLEEIQEAPPAENTIAPAANSTEDKTIETENNSAANSSTITKLPATQKQSRWGVEYYITPTYSYRYLTESKIVDLHQTQNGPIAPNLVKSVNNFVSHQPIFGMEAGAGIVYQATSNLQLTTGLQLSTRGYSIEAYAANREPSAIVLNRGYYTDSILALSSYSNQNGYKEVTLTNRYWQVAVPIGINLKLAESKKLKLNVAASVQPTYQINNAANILSSDYKNYLSEPSLTRHWNVNTAIGAFVSYDAAGLNWQLGPQIRYQVLSGTVNDYPIKEHLLDYGVKIGVVKTLK